MSRIAKVPISIPDKVEVNIAGHHIKVKGPKGQLELDVSPMVKVKKQDGQLKVERRNDERQSKAFHGLYYRLIRNMIVGVVEGYERQLEIVGVGYRAAKEGNNLVLQLGYSQPIRYEPPQGIQIEVPKPNNVIIKGIDKQKVGQVAAIIRGFRSPEPYKGKGIRYLGEYVRRKVGKAGAK